MVNTILPKFQDFLLSRSFVTAKNAPFYAHCVSRFLAFSKRYQEPGSILRFQKFFNLLESNKKIADWQNSQTLDTVCNPSVNGVNIRRMQNLLGHKHVETTMIYTHLLRDGVSVPRNLLDK